MRYEKLTLIDGGSSGTVFKGRDNQTGEIIAIKEIDLEDEELQGDFAEIENEIRQEVTLLAHCDIPSIIKYRGSVLDGSKLWILMDYCELGSLRVLLNRVGPLDEKAVIYVAFQCLKALSYLHRNGIVHRDIKAANILLTSAGLVRVADFGVASANHLHGNEQKKAAMVGSPYWMAPEVIRECSFDGKADIWSFGITLIELLLGSPPLADLEPSRALFLIPRSAPPRLDSVRFSADLCQLVAICLHDDPSKRPSADQLLQLRMFKRRNLLSSQDAGGPATMAKYIERLERIQESDQIDRSILDRITAFNIKDAPQSVTNKVDNPLTALNDPVISEDFTKSNPLQQQQQSAAINSTCDVELHGSDFKDTAHLSESMPKTSSLFAIYFEHEASNAFRDPLSLLQTVHNRAQGNHHQELELYHWPFSSHSDTIPKKEIVRMMIKLKLKSLPKNIPIVHSATMNQIDRNRALQKMEQYFASNLDLIHQACIMLNKLANGPGPAAQTS